MASNRQEDWLASIRRISNGQIPRCCDVTPAETTSASLVSSHYITLFRDRRLVSLNVSRHSLLDVGLCGAELMASRLSVRGQIQDCKR